MAQRPREEEDDDDRIQPAPAPPSFPSLPDLAHASIASFLPDGNKGNESRLRVSGASCALFKTYGGSLTRMHVRYVAESSAARVAALLRRHKKLADVIVKDQQTISALSLAIVQGCCQGIEKATLSIRKTVLTQERVNLLAGALEVDGALPALRCLTLDCIVTPGDLSRLMRALTGGTAPLLRHLSLTVDGVIDSDMESIADMLEARVRIPGCNRLESFKWDSNWFDRASLTTRIRLLQVLLPSVMTLEKYTWNEAFEICFLEVQPPRLTELKVLLEDEGNVFSSDVLETIPAVCNQ